MADLSSIFAALADPVRRSIVERLVMEGDHTVGEIAAPLDISAPAVSRHLQVLERAGIIERRVKRQWRVVGIRPGSLTEVETWLSAQKRHWNSALDRMEAVMAEQTSKRKKS